TKHVTRRALCNLGGDTMCGYKKRQQRLNKKRQRARARARERAVPPPVTQRAQTPARQRPPTDPSQGQVAASSKGVIFVLDRGALIPGLDPDDPAVDAILEYVLACACA